MAQAGMGRNSAPNSGQQATTMSYAASRPGQVGSLVKFKHIVGRIDWVLWVQFAWLQVSGLGLGCVVRPPLGLVLRLGLGSTVMTKIESILIIL